MKKKLHKDHLYMQLNQHLFCFQLLRIVDMNISSTNPIPNLSMDTKQLYSAWNKTVTVLWKAPQWGIQSMEQIVSVLWKVPRWGIQSMEQRVSVLWIVPQWGIQSMEQSQSFGQSRSGIQRSQKQRYPLLRTKNCTCSPFEAWCRSNIATHSLPTAMNFFIVRISTFPIHSFLFLFF